MRFDNVCRGCGLLFEEATTVCPNCGCCPNCGTEQDKAATRCLHCGYSFEQAFTREETGVHDLPKLALDHAKSADKKEEKRPRKWRVIPDLKRDSTKWEGTLEDLVFYLPLAIMLVALLLFCCFFSMLGAALSPLSVK